MSEVIKKIEMQNGIGGWDERPLGVYLENIFVNEEETLGDFTGATESAAGKTGLVPAPAVADREKVLRGDGTWGTIKSLDYTIDGEAGKYSTIQNAVEDGSVEIGGSTVEFTKNVASGWFSHAEGRETTASGDYSHAEGSKTTASGEASHAGGRGVIAQGEFQTAIGKFNVAQGTSDSYTDSDYALIIGNGTYANPSNALAIQWDGTIVFANGETLTPAQITALKALLN